MDISGLVGEISFSAKVTEMKDLKWSTCSSDLVKKTDCIREIENNIPDFTEFIKTLIVIQY